TTRTLACRYQTGGSRRPFFQPRNKARSLQRGLLGRAAAFLVLLAAAARAGLIPADLAAARRLRPSLLLAQLHRLEQPQERRRQDGDALLPLLRGHREPFEFLTIVQCQLEDRVEAVENVLIVLETFGPERLGRLHAGHEALRPDLPDRCARCLHQ